MNKEKRTLGIGSLALLFALISMVSLIRVNGSSVFDYLFGLADVSSRYITPSVIFLLSVSGIIIGFLNRRDWGSKWGGVLCVLNLISGVSLVTSWFS
ncbi:hypothetical protein ACFFNY_21205 [Paenibacillus hodogayensis]|uniref:Uncharacterized protein n=1 Tax=Paenibacillus hodogayensis TaxID=279208 RepID=A0ABV5W0K1_9BACL